MAATIPKILVVDDDEKATELIRLYLERNGYRVLVAHDGRTALDMARSRHPDLMVLDLMLPLVDGLDVCRNLRASLDTADIPIIMLTARTTEDDKLMGLDLGADDYVTKPFSPRELVARVRAVLRRAGKNGDNGPEEIRAGDLTVNFLRHEVRLGDETIYLTPKEFSLLATMIKAPERVFSRTELVEKAFGFDYEGMERTVDVHVLKLRRKIEPDPAQPTYVQTVYGVGYKFAAIEEASHV